MQRHLEAWLQRKLERRLTTIRAARLVRFEFGRQVGPKGEFAVIHLRGEPAAEFSFHSIAHWPASLGDYSDHVLDGILDELFATDLGPVAGRVRFTLEQIDWNPVDSSASAFYRAARGAVREILGSGNIVY